MFISILCCFLFALVFNHTHNAVSKHDFLIELQLHWSTILNLLIALKWQPFVSGDNLSYYYWLDWMSSPVSALHTVVTIATASPPPPIVMIGGGRERQKWTKCLFQQFQQHGTDWVVCKQSSYSQTSVCEKGKAILSLNNSLRNGVLHLAHVFVIDATGCGSMKQEN